MRLNLVMISLFIISSMISVFASSIHLNQVGFYPLEQKNAIVIGAESDTFTVTDSKKKVVFKGVLKNEKYWDASDERARRAEFSSLKEPGTYTIKIKRSPDSCVFRISTTVLQDVVKSSVKSFYFNRASSKLDALYAGKWTRNAGHPDTAALIHPSAATDSVSSGSKYSAPGGWYDAGDFGKYIVNSGISVYTLFVTGYGSRSPVEIHHRVSVADSIKEIVPGFLVGGPNAAQQDSIHCKDCYTSKLPALSYSESYHSYASNEVAINWSAPMVFLTGAVEALQTKYKKN